MLDQAPHIRTPSSDISQESLAFGLDLRLDRNDVIEDQIEHARHRYSGLLIQLDHLRPVIAGADVLYRETGNAWSIKEILGHLIDTDREIWWPRIKAILESDRPFFADIDQHELVRKHHWQSIPIEDVFLQLMRVRWEYSMRLNLLPDSAFSREGDHATLGTITLLQIVQLLVSHDAHYLEMIHGIVESTGKRVG